MSKVTSLADLRKIKADAKAKMNLLNNSGNAESMVQIRVAMATCGIASGAKIVMDYLMNELEKRNIPAMVTQTGCMGYCYAEPTVRSPNQGATPLPSGMLM